MGWANRSQPQVKEDHLLRETRTCCRLLVMLMICWLGMLTMTSISCLITAVCSWIIARCKGLRREQDGPWLSSVLLQVTPLPPPTPQNSSDGQQGSLTLPVPPPPQNPSCAHVSPFSSCEAARCLWTASSMRGSAVTE